MQNHYYLNLCEDSCLPQLAQFLQEEGLELLANTPEEKQWYGVCKSLKREEELERTLKIKYTKKMRAAPLEIKTTGNRQAPSYKDPDVKAFLNRLMEVCGNARLLNSHMTAYNPAEDS